MPGRFSIVTPLEEINERFAVRFDDRSIASSNVKPSYKIPILVRQDGKREAKLARWGLVPQWAKTVKVGYKMINARAETLLEKPSFKPLIKSAASRCVIVADAYYEWLKREHKSQKAEVFRFSLAEGELFTMAGLWTTWHSPQDEEVVSCTLITTEANNDVLKATLHERMPVVYRTDEEIEAWLGDQVDGPAAVKLLTKLPDGVLGCERAENL